MCYGFKPLYHKEGGGAFMVPLHELYEMELAGKIIEKPDGYHYAKDTVGAITAAGARSMRWDLIPAFYLQGENLTAAEAIKKKNSRAKNPATGKSWGFSSFNARVESVATLPSFRGPWAKGQRCVLPTVGYKERPNMDGAPKDFQGREFEIVLDGTYYMAGLWDAWQSRAGEAIESCTVITMSSEGHALMRSIWHERIPILLTEAEAAEWLDPTAAVRQALKLCKQLNPEKMRIVQ
jgi:putative SOS response-associated peptidase YedK